MTIEASLPRVTDLMEEGHDYLQRGDILTASTAFLDALDGASPSDVRTLAEANQMLGICARLRGNLDDAEAHLIKAAALADMYRLEVILSGTIHRDLGAVHASLYRIYRTGFSGFTRGLSEKHRDLARHHYELSERLFVSSTEPAAVELYVTKGYALFLEWHVADELPWEKRLTEKARISDDLEQQYINLRHRYDTDRCLMKINPDAQKHQAYQANLLIRVVRTEPLLQRLTHRGELMRLTDPDSASAGSRTRALVALLFGERVYSWFELRKARQSR